MKIEAFGPAALACAMALSVSAPALADDEPIWRDLPTGKNPSAWRLVGKDGAGAESSGYALDAANVVTGADGLKMVAVMTVFGNPVVRQNQQVYGVEYVIAIDCAKGMTQNLHRGFLSEHFMGPPNRNNKPAWIAPPANSPADVVMGMVCGKRPMPTGKAYPNIGALDDAWAAGAEPGDK